METRKALTEIESKALDIVREYSEQAWTTDEITAEVASGLSISLNAAKGYIGQLTLKGWIEKCKTNVNGVNMYQFHVLD